MIHPLASITLLKFLSDETGFHRFDPGFADVLLTCGVAACGGGEGEGSLEELKDEQR